MRRLSRCLLVAVAVAVAAPAVRAAEVDPLLPKETEQVVHVNVKQILDSDVIKKYALGQIKQAMQGNDVKAQLESLGLDPLKDIEKLSVGLWGKDANDMSAVAVLRGKFDAKKLFDSAKDQAGKTPDKVAIEEDGSFKLVKITGDNGKPFFVTVADEGTIVGGSAKALVTDTLTAFNKKEKAKLSKELTALVLKQDEKASMYFCGVVEGKLGEIPAEPLSQIPGVDGAAFKKHLEKMVTMAMTVRLGKDVGVDVTMGMKDEDTAEEFGGKDGSLTKLIDTAKTFLPLAAGQQPKAKPLIDELVKTLGTSVKGKDVSLKLAVTADAIGSVAGASEDKDK